MGNEWAAREVWQGNHNVTEHGTVAYTITLSYFCGCM